MYIHKLGKSTSGGGGRFIRGFRSNSGTMGIVKNQKRTKGSGFVPLRRLFCYTLSADGSLLYFFKSIFSKVLFSLSYI